REAPVVGPGTIRLGGKAKKGAGWGGGKGPAAKWLYLSSGAPPAAPGRHRRFRCQQAAMRLGRGTVVETKHAFDDALERLGNVDGARAPAIGPAGMFVPVQLDAKCLGKIAGRSGQFH